MIQFANPEYLYLLFLVPVIAFYIARRRSTPFIRFSDVRLIKMLKPTLRVRLRWLPNALKIVALCLLIIALARPQSTHVNYETVTEGIDVVIALDISTSMLAQDFQPNRFKASIEVAKEFIKGRKNDRIGLVVFAGESYTQCPLTSDYKILLDLLDKIVLGNIEDGTAIGDGLINAVNRLRESQAKSKVVILLTDGENNRGEVAPETAADAAKAMGVRIYTIGVGEKFAPYPVQDFFGRTILQQVEFNIDETMLSYMAKITDGKYFRARSANKLKAIYKEIDEMENTKIKTNTYRRYAEKYLVYLISGLSLLFAGIILENTLFKRSL